MFCSQCGAQVPEGSTFCPMCGADLRAETPEPQPTPPRATLPAPVPPPVPPAPVWAPAVVPLPTAPQPTVPFPSVAGAVGGSYPKGPLGARLLAVIVDGLIAGALLPAGVLLILAASAREEFSIIGVVLALLGAVWAIAYALGRDIAGGAGFGKRLAGIVVVSSATGEPAKGWATVLRQLVLYALNIIPGIGSLIEPIMVFADKDGRRLGDKAAKTQVVRASDVASRGIPLKTGKGMAIGALVAALVLSMIGGVVGGLVFARTVAGNADFSESITGFEPPAGDLVAEDPAVETPAEEPLVDPGTEEQVGAVNAESAVNAVGNLLNSLKEDDVATAREYATRFFQEQEDWFFQPAGGALIQFEVVDVYPDAAIWVVEVKEEWNSGPEATRYFVIEEDNAARVDGVDLQE